MVRKVTGGEKPPADRKEKSAEVDEEPRGVQVDFYLVIVGQRPVSKSLIGQFLKFIASIVPTIEVDSTTATSM